MDRPEYMLNLSLKSLTLSTQTFYTKLTGAVLIKFVLKHYSCHSSVVTVPFSVVGLMCYLCRAMKGSSVHEKIFMPFHIFFYSGLGMLPKVAVST